METTSSERGLCPPEPWCPVQTQDASPRHLARRSSLLYVLGGFLYSTHSSTTFSSTRPRQTKVFIWLGVQAKLLTNVAIKMFIADTWHDICNGAVKLWLRWRVYPKHSHSGHFFTCHKDSMEVTIIFIVKILRILIYRQEWRHTDGSHLSKITHFYKKLAIQLRLVPRSPTHSFVNLMSLMCKIIWVVYFPISVAIINWPGSLLRVQFPLMFRWPIIKARWICEWKPADNQPAGEIVISPWSCWGAVSKPQSKGGFVETKVAVILRLSTQ